MLGQPVFQRSHGVSALHSCAGTSALHVSAGAHLPAGLFPFDRNIVRYAAPLSLLAAR